MSRRSLLSLAIALVLVGIAAGYLWQPISRTVAQADLSILESEPDIPSMLAEAKSRTPKDDFLRFRADHFGILRGLDGDGPKDPTLREKALVEMDEQLSKRSAAPEFADNLILANTWNKIGPAPLIAGTARNSGRVIAIAVHPTNPNVVYVGTAQGGLYRSTDGGTNWTAMMDNAQSLAIGAIAFAPSDPETIYIGTGEHNFSADSFFGVGVYRINNASTTANLTGPYNKTSGNADIFTGRGISEIVVHPTDPNTIFVSSTRGIGGMGATSNSSLPSQGIYRSTNANGATPTFAKLTGLAGGADVAVRDIAIDPTNANILVAGVVAGGAVGGIYRSADALAATPIFTQLQVFDSTTTSELTTEFAAIKPVGATDAVFYAATGNLGGRVLRSPDGGLTWNQQIDNNFCTPQCFYNIAIDVDPTNADKVLVGGAPAVVIGVSTNAGVAFTERGSASGVHVDTHAVEFAPSDANIIYLGTDGGIYKSVNGGTNWTHLNTEQFFATQFMSIAVHPTDPNYTIGGTQDNGTNAYTGTSGVTWNRVDGGDGGFTIIDQNATDTATVRMYHTYFSQTNNVVGYATRGVGGSGSGGWSFRGCQGTTPANGITCGDTVLFYAPLERGPGNPNTVYYATDRLYRSNDLGVTHTVVSQAPISAGNAISAVAIGPQDDNLRLVGVRNGLLMGTATGSTTLIDLDPTNTIPNNYISRIVIDPSNSNNAFVVISAFGVNNVFKTTNLNNLVSATAPTWTLARGTGGNVIPQVPVNAMVIDPQNGQTVYAGTDIGVYVTTDGGANWAPFGTGLPRVAVFGMAISPAPRKLRIATHGKGMYEVSLAADRVTPFDYDGDDRSDVSVWRSTTGTWYVGRSSLSDMYVQPWGLAGDTIVPADYDGDGKTDLAVRRPADNNFYVFNSSNSTVEVRNFGVAGDVAVPSDYNGDGKADVSVWRPSTGTWYLSLSGSGIFYVMPWGLSSDKPAPGDFDGDGKTELVVFRPSDGKWYTFSTVTGTISVTEWGVNGDRPVQGDYNGDGRTDFAVYRPSNNTWYRQNSNDGAVTSTQWGLAGDFPVPGDYDGDGKIDVAVWRPSDATWYVNRSSSGIFTQTFGLTGDTPTPSAFVF